MEFSLESLFKPRTIALVGVSSDPNKLSGRPLKFLLEYNYPGDIYPINPHYQEIQGLKCYPSLLDVPGEIDLAIISLAAREAIPALQECAAKGVHAATIFSSGFAERDDAGMAMQEQLSRIARSGGVALCGPNCAGHVSLQEKAIASFVTAMEYGTLLAGPIAFISQSGALGSYIFAVAQEQGLGFNYWVSTGNEAVLNFADYVSYFVEDDSTEVIVGYMEEARDLSKLATAAKKAIGKNKFLIILKVGRFQAGAKAAALHTGSFAGDDAEYEAYFRQTGILRAYNEEELLDLAKICSMEKKPAGRRVALVTISGGAGILMADKCEEEGLELATPAPATKAALKAALPVFASAANPVDVTAELSAKPQLLKPCLDILVADPNVDAVLIFLGLQPSQGDLMAQGIADVARITSKPVIVNWMLPPGEAMDILNINNIPVFPNATRGVKALAVLTKYLEERQATSVCGPKEV